MIAVTCTIHTGDTLPVAVSTVVAASDASSFTQGSFPHSRKGTAYLRNYTTEHEKEGIFQHHVGTTKNAYIKVHVVSLK